MSPRELADHLAKEYPRFHYADEDVVRRAAKGGYYFEPGELSIAVSPGVLRWIANHVTDTMTTIETGAGHTTVLLGAIARQHTCCTFKSREIEKISQYMQQIGLSLEKTTFVQGSTDQTLPTLPVEATFDFAYIDGCHGYPFPAMDWHHVDLRLKVGGILGMDNAELRPVRE